MTHHDPDRTSITAALELLVNEGFDGMANAIALLLNEAMKLERSEFLGAGPYERTEERRGYGNGFKPKHVKSRLGELDLSVPKVRDLAEGIEPFYPRALERGERSERALKLAVAEMYVQGVSTRKVTEITKELCGLEVSSSQVSRVAKQLDDELEAWRTRELGEYRYLLLDARYEKVRHGGHVVSCALLYAVGIDLEGKRSVLGVSVSLSEAEVHWRALLKDLVERGLHGVRMITSDDHAGIKAALAATFSGVAWQRCQFHLQQNATAYVPRVDQRPDAARDIRSIFNAPDRAEAERLLNKTINTWQESAPRLAAWMDENLPEGFTVFDLPPAHRRRLRTSNLLERLSREIKRRTRVATLFPNEASLLRLASAILVEVSEEWETGRCYLNMESE
ncbi:MAG: IS256 family transposase [bacterium]|nr:IS256 family transposase [bacterium]